MIAGKRGLFLEQLEDRMLLSGGALDPSFGSGGRVSVAGIGRTANAILQADGKIVSVGGLNGDVVIQRFNADGSADAAFGINGRVIRDLGSSNDVALGVLQQPDGKLVIAGFTTTTTGNDFAVARFEANGTLDATFGSGGLAITDFAGGNDLAADVVLQGNGKLVAAGRTAVAGSDRTDFALARYSANGALDVSFGTGGKVVTDFGDFDGATRAAMQPDGKIVAAGGSGFSVARYSSNGSLDTTFGTAGKVALGTGGTANALAVLNDGKILVGGDSADDSAEVFDFALARLNANGSLDGLFGSGGQVSTRFGNRSSTVFGFAVEADGKILATGSATTSSPIDGDSADFILARYFSNGRLDTSFGASGSVINDLGSDLDEANSVLIASDGNYIQVGSVGPDTTALQKISSTLPRQDVIPPLDLYVTQLYADLLLREPDLGGLQSYTSYLSQSPSPARFLPLDQQAGFLRMQVAQQFVGSLEFFNVELEEVYADLLGREVDPSGRQTWTGFLARGGTREQLEASVLGSSEFLKRAQDSNLTFLQAVYQSVLGRDLDASGNSTWSAALAAGVSRTDVALSILQSPESDFREVQLLYNQYLGRDADPVGLETFLTALQAGIANEQIIAILVSSSEYFQSV